MTARTDERVLADLGSIARHVLDTISIALVNRMFRAMLRARGE